MATTIATIRATPVTVPLEAPLLHSNGAHWGRFVRTVVEIETNDGYMGLGEMGGGGDDAARAFAALESYLRGITRCTTSSAGTLTIATPAGRAGIR